ncbi:MAG: AsmA-like C-terminal region-containing protein [Bacteroidota bacterium]|nr:AsmA-like C-terminal region-containing protein [Bacteroidota bacterium]
MSRTPLSRIFRKTLKITGIAVGLLLLFMVLFPYIFPGFISKKIRQWARSNIRSELNFSSARLSFFKRFPALTLTLYDFSLKGAEPFGKDALVEADEVALGVDLRTALSSEIRIDKIFLTGAFINVQVDSAGHANYDVYVSKGGNAPSVPSDSGSASLKIRKILIEKSNLVYNDRSLPMRINARDLYYKGNGDLSNAIFDLNSHTEIGSMDLYYDRKAYFLSKKINADLVTRVNTNSLALFFDKNELLINQLPVTFNGRFEFLKNGYDMDFHLKSRSDRSDLRDIFSAMPPSALDWLDKTDVRGYGGIEAALKGQYIAGSGRMPDLDLNMKIREGYVANAKAGVPLKNLYLDFWTKVPQLDPDSMSGGIDSLYFNVDKDYLGAVMRWKGFHQPYIFAKINSEMDLQNLGKAIGLEPFELRGKYALHLEADGNYRTRPEPSHSLRKKRPETVVSSIPSFQLTSSLRDGYFQYASRPAAIRDIHFNLDASCPDQDYRHAAVSVEDLNARVLNNFIKGRIKLGRPGDFHIEAGLESVFHLADLKQVYPMDSLDLAGDLNVHVQTKGDYRPGGTIFPVTVANLSLNNGSIRTRYYPHPLENIQLSAKVSSRGGSLRDLDVNLTPVSFQLEGQPFMVRADLQDFENLQYRIVSRGTLDVGKLSRVFGARGYDVRGLIETRLFLRGRQSDAVTGRYDQLFNSGTLHVRDLQVSSELFPQPFLIRNGLFRFDQDRMYFDRFHASYGRSDLRLNGWLSNVTAYMTDKHSPLKGSFDLKSDFLLADEFMAFGVRDSTAGGGGGGGGGDAGTGVLIVPDNLSISVNAGVSRVRYQGMDLEDCQGQMVIDSGALTLSRTGFTLIGAPVVMDARYKSLSPRRAVFDYHISAKEFDVKKAYARVKLFHDLAGSASKAEGIISLDYQLAGRLDQNMHPIYPSLKGGGVLAVKKVKVKGLRLFGAVSKESGKNVNDPDLSKVEIKTTINNNIITLARTRMKVSAFKLRMEGQASFDGRLNLRFRVGLPPFGVIGIPLTVTGTQENPRVKARKGSDQDELEATEDKDEAGSQ